MTKLIAISIIRNEYEHYLKDWLNNVEKYADYHIIVDDFSDDGKTVEHIQTKIKNGYSAELHILNKSLFKDNEVKLRNILWEYTRQYASDGDWIMVVDADEFYYDLKYFLYLKNKIFNHRIKEDGITINCLDMWDKNHFRVDGYWSPNYVKNRIIKFKNLPFIKKIDEKSDLHKSPLPEYAKDFKFFKSNLSMVHKSYVDDSNKKRKYDFYKTNVKDPIPYKHALSILDKKPILLKYPMFKKNYLSLIKSSIKKIFKIFINIFLCFIPSKNLRKRIRGKKNIINNEKEVLISIISNLDKIILNTFLDLSKEINDDEILKLKLLELKSQYINTKEYWDKRFSKNSWTNANGEAQTRENYLASFNYIPEDIKNEIINNSYTMVDFGCALGDGVPLLSKFFGNTKRITGIDISSSGIEKAKIKFPEFDFEAIDLTKSNKKFNILYSSNVFEHFVYPYKIMNELTKNITNYFIVVVPYNGEITEEHFYTFNKDTIQKELNNSFKLIYFKNYTIGESFKSKNVDEYLISMGSGVEYYKYYDDFSQSILIYKMIGN